MRTRAGIWVVCGLAVLACHLNTGCTGTPGNFHAVTLTPSAPQTIGTGTTLNITAAVANDSSGAGVTWNTPANGTLTNKTTTSATYNAPAVPAGTTTQDTVIAISVTYPNQSAILVITVAGTPVITTTSLPGGNWGSPYSATVNSVGGVPPFTWAITSGSLTTGLSLGANTGPSVTISGTPGAQVDSNFTLTITDSTGASFSQPLTIAIGAPLPLQITTTSLPDGALNVAYPATTLQASGGVPPFTWMLTSAPATFPPGLNLASDGTISGTPTAVGTFNFTVQVSDSQPTAATATGNLSITVDNLGPLNGDYAFRFGGFDANGAVVMAGSFTADGKGNITSGVEDVNMITGPPANHTFTGTYTLGNDGRGVLTFSSLPGSPTYAFALDPGGTQARFIELDASGIRGSGHLLKRSLSTCSANTLDGNWAFGVSGHVIAVAGNPAGPAVMEGGYTAAAGNVGPGETDASWPGQVVTRNSLSGTYQTNAQATRCTMTLTPASIPAMTFSVYPVSNSMAFMVETDTANSTTPTLTVGEMHMQVGAPYFGAPGSTFTATSVAGWSGSGVPSGGASYLDYEAVVQIASDGSGTFSLPIVENFGGTVTSALGANAPTGNFANSDQFGRVETSLINPSRVPVFYVFGQNAAFSIFENLNSAVIGIFEPQATGPFSATTIAGSFPYGTGAPPSAAAPNFSGALTLASTSSTSGTVNGTQDTSTSSGNTPAQAVSGTYNITDQNAGVGTVTLSAPSSFTGTFFIVSPTQLVMISTTNTDANPVLIFLGN